MLGFCEQFRMHPGPVQVTRKVKVNVPGKHFPQLSAPEQKEVYSGTAVEFKDKHKFARHAKAWGAEHTGPGIMFICESDAIDDPDHKGFWTTLTIWNKWRHETYKDNSEADPFLRPTIGEVVALYNTKFRPHVAQRLAALAAARAGPSSAAGSAPAGAAAPAPAS